MNSLDKTYTDLLQDIIDNGVVKGDRTGTGTISVFGRQIRHNMKDGFPLLTTKKMQFKSIVTELLWFLKGDTNIKYLLDNGCNIWTGDAYKAYIKAFNEGKADGLSPMCKGVPDEIISKKDFVDFIKNCDELGTDEFTKKWGDLGPIYGKQWRSWGDKNIDQIQNLIKDVETNPDSRRLMVNAWNVADLDDMTLPPCHYGFQVYTRKLSYKERYDYWFSKNYETGMERNYEIQPDFDNNYYNRTPVRAISLMWNQRSVDTFLGLPFNIASYGLLLMMLADEVGMIPDQLIGNLGDVHLYSNHIEQAKEQIGRELTLEERGRIFYQKGYKVDLLTFSEDLNNDYDGLNIAKRTREPFPLPKLFVRDGIYSSGLFDVVLENYESHLEIKAPLSN